MHPGGFSPGLRRFDGPEATELAILGRPESKSANTAQQAEAVYRDLASVFANHRTSFRDLVSETLFLRDVRCDLPLVLAARARVLADLGQTGWAPAPAFIQQAPLTPGVSFELSASVIVPHRRDAWSVRDVPAAAACACEGCAKSGARILRLGEQTSLYTSNVYGTGKDAFEQAWNTFAAADRLLQQGGMGFRDVVRTWIHVRDIDRDYEALNRARRAFFQQCGVEPRPASTGVQGVPLPAAHDFSISLVAMHSPRPIEITPMSTASLAEAWSYGADFSRGLKVVDANKVTLYISGTASVDEGGRTVHAGDFAAQADRMLHNIASLLSQQGANFDSLFSAVAYLKDPKDAAMLHSLFRQHGLQGFPCALVEAPLCRPELLCETEVVAVLPLATSGA